MKEKFEIIIDANREALWASFVDPDRLGRWRQSLDSFDQKSGEPGQHGAVTEQVHRENGRRIVLTETITECREPDFLAATYESAQVSALIVNHFEPVDDHSTRWTAWCNIHFRGGMKFLSLFAAGPVRRRLQGDMERFKLMVESDLAGKES